MALSSGHTSGNFAPRGSVALVPVTQRWRTHGGPGGPGDSEDTLENTWARSYQDLHTEWLTHEMPVSARKRAKGGEFKERLKMRKEDDRSHLVNLFLTARASSIEFAPAFGAPAFGVGQSILQWWAPWFKDCLEGAVPDNYNAKNRPKWFSGEVTAYAGTFRVIYAGRAHEGHCYDTY